MTEHSDEITHPEEFRSRWPIFPNPSFGPGALLIRRVHAGEHPDYLYRSMGFSTTDQRLSSFVPRTGRDETKTGTNLQEDVSRTCLSLWPRGINNISRDLLEFLLPLPPSAPHDREDPPSKRSRHWRVPWRAAILMDTRYSMGTKGCWFNVEGVFVVLMRYNRMDPGCWCIARSGVPRTSAGPPLVETPVDSGRNTSITCHGYVFRHISLSSCVSLSFSPSVTLRILHLWNPLPRFLASSSYSHSVAC